MKLFYIDQQTTAKIDYFFGQKYTGMGDNVCEFNRGEKK